MNLPAYAFSTISLLFAASSYAQDASGENNPIRENIAAAIPYSSEQTHPVFAVPLTDANPHSSTYAHQFTLDSIVGKGKPVALNFWEPWCSPCMREMPEFEELSHNSNILVYGLSSQYASVLQDTSGQDEKYGAAKNILAKVTYPFVGFEKDSSSVLSLIQSFNLHGTNFPTTVFFSSQGRLDGVYVGILSPQQLDDIVTRLK